MEEPVFSKQGVAVIDIGSSAIRLLIAEVGQKSEIKRLENLQKPVNFGKDVFTTGRISSESLRSGIAILKNYKQVIEGYGIKKIQAIATSAVRDAVNRDNFIDQVFVRTGIDIEVIEGPEENRLELIAVEQSLSGKFDYENKNCLIVEVSSGGTELIILNQGKVEVTRTLSMGSIRLPEKAVAGKTELVHMQKLLQRSIHDVAKYAAAEFAFEQVDTFIALGAEMRFVCRQLVEKIEGTFVILEKKAFVNFVNSLAKKKPDELMSQYSLSYSEAEQLYPSLLFYVNFLNETKAENVIVPMASIRDALLFEMAQMLSGYKRTDVSKQVLNSAKHLAEKFKYDKPHANAIVGYAVKLFDLLKEDHGLRSRERLLLEVSALLHDIGIYISPVSHHKHSSYLIDASEIFGLRKQDKKIVANVVRYHRKATPQESHVEYMSLTRNDRAVVSKLASLLRVADALDSSHQQKIKTFTIERADDGYSIWVPEEVGDVTPERQALIEKGQMFSEVYGMSISLKQGTPEEGTK